MLKTKTVLELTIGGMLLLAAPDLRAQSLNAVPIQESGLNVALGDITDSRTNGKFFQYLRIEVKLSGAALETPLAPGTLLPKPEGIFPRFIEPAAAS